MGRAYPDTRGCLLKRRTGGPTATLTYTEQMDSDFESNRSGGMAWTLSGPGRSALYAAPPGSKSRPTSTSLGRMAGARF